MLTVAVITVLLLLGLWVMSQTNPKGDR